jgi:hypothetical protein
VGTGTIEPSKRPSPSTGPGVRQGRELFDRQHRRMHPGNTTRLVRPASDGVVGRETADRPSYHYP